MIRKMYVIIIVAIIIVAGVTSFLVFANAPSSSSCANIGKTIHFTIYENDYGPLEGMNGSVPQYYNGVVNWPIMRVQCNDTVVIHVSNANSSEAHGFQILYYFSGVALQPGQSTTVTFKATKVGTFRVYCDIQCAIHALMQNGELIVSQ